MLNYYFFVRVVNSGKSWVITFSLFTNRARASNVDCGGRGFAGGRNAVRDMKK